VPATRAPTSEQSIILILFFGVEMDLLESYELVDFEFPSFDDLYLLDHRNRHEFSG
jgi:hypothetical protein